MNSSPPPGTAGRPTGASQASAATEGVGRPALADDADRTLGHDPLAESRTPTSPGRDVLCAGLVFLDIIFTGLPSPPTLGREIWSEGMGSCPGGVANVAVALSRLGLRTTLAAPFGADAYGDFCWQILEEEEGIDLSRSRRFRGWHSPVTISMAYERDRALVTHGHPSPIPFDEFIGTPPACRAVVRSLEEEPEVWPNLAREAGAQVFADVGWDPSGNWSRDTLRQLAEVDAFLPNSVEAMAYTRTDSADRALSALAEQVPIAVITLGPDGAIAADQTTGESVRVPGLATDALDPTGAGDVFVAAFTTGTLAGWPLEYRLRFAVLCAGLSVRHFGGSLSAPGWADIATWWTESGSVHADLAKAYGFLTDLLPAGAVKPVTRAPATIGLRPDR
ncbi:MAG TPA: carbohydrate kinase family protein [Jiangellaceae bacterium]|nr:carbohydrate kinase family protein [Jiangellaceae bacterium]